MKALSLRNSIMPQPLGRQ